MLLALLKESLSLILLEHPTRGLDIESTLYIWGKLRERCAQGAAIIFISADLDEVLQYSDRVLVFFSGRVSPPLPGGRADRGAARRIDRRQGMGVAGRSGT